MSGSLKGIRIHLAGSVPESILREDTLGILSFVQQFTAVVLNEGGTLIHGSHPTFHRALRAAAEGFVADNGARDSLTLVRSHVFANTHNELAEIEEQRKYSAVNIIPSDPNNPHQSLVPMREWMAERCDVVVAIGGNYHNDNKSNIGVPIELEESLRRGKPGFAIAGFGGAIKTHIDRDPTVISRLKNGLSVEANQTLATSTDVTEIVSTIISQLKRLPLSRENIPSGRFFRILALDGGGLRGAFSAAVLAKWDDMLGSSEKNNLIRHFDMVAGTSTGAILAIGLSLGCSPKEMLEFYRAQGPQIFPKDRALRHWLKSKHDSKTLADTLKVVLGDSKLSFESCCRLVIPTVRADHGESEVIVTAHSPDRTGFKSTTAVEAALASAAAPTYFDEAHVADTIVDQAYLDGGIWANNPILPAIAEAVRHLNIPLDRIDVLSVGTLGNEVDFTKSLGQGKAGWLPQTADLFFAAQEHAAGTIADALLTRARHLRVNQQTPIKIELDDTKALEDMVKRGDNVGKDSFIDVRSRFLDGFHALDWRSGIVSRS